MDLPPIRDVVHFLEANIPAPSVLVEGLIHRGTKVALGGASKAKKTWTQLLLATCVSHGIPFLGHATKQGKVLVVNLEVPEWAILGRLRQVAGALGIQFIQDRLDIWNLRGYAADHALLIPKINERVQQGYALIVIDPIYKIYGNLDENSAGDVALLLNTLERLAVSSGAAIVFAAHFSKGNQSGRESLDRISGSGVFARDPDTLLIFTKHEEDDCFTVEPTLRNFPPIDPFVVRWQHPLMLLDDLLDPSRLKKNSRPKKKFTLDMVLGALEMGEPLSATALAKELGCSRRTLYETLIPQMKQHPSLSRNEKDEWLLVNLKGDLNHNGNNH